MKRGKKKGTPLTTAQKMQRRSRVTVPGFRTKIDASGKKVLPKHLDTVRKDSLSPEQFRKAHLRVVGAPPRIDTPPDFLKSDGIAFWQSACSAVAARGELTAGDLHGMTVAAYLYQQMTRKMRDGEDIKPSEATILHRYLLEYGLTPSADFFAKDSRGGKAFTTPPVSNQHSGTGAELQKIIDTVERAR